jgi:hypothetical protein
MWFGWLDSKRRLVWVGFRYTSVANSGPLFMTKDRLCGLMVRVPGYRSSGPGFDSQSYQISWEVVDLERVPLGPVSTIEELLERKSSGSGLESWEYSHRNPLRWPRDTLYLQNLALTLPTSSGCSVGRVRLRTKATGFSFFLILTLLRFWRNCCILAGPCGQTTKVLLTYLSH